MMASSSSLPSLDGRLMRTVPLRTAIIWSPGAPMVKMLSPASNVLMRARAEIAERSLSLMPLKRTQFSIRRRAPIIASFDGAEIAGIDPLAVPVRTRQRSDATGNSRLLPPIQKGEVVIYNRKYIYFAPGLGGAGQGLRGEPFVVWATGGLSRLIEVRHFPNQVDQLGGCQRESDEGKGQELEHGCLLRFRGIRLTAGGGRRPVTYVTGGGSFL